MVAGLLEKTAAVFQSRATKETAARAKLLREYSKVLREGENADPERLADVAGKLGRDEVRVDQDLALVARVKNLENARRVDDVRAEYDAAKVDHEKIKATCEASARKVNDLECRFQCAVRVQVDLRQIREEHSELFG